MAAFGKGGSGHGAAPDHFTLPAICYFLLLLFSTCGMMQPIFIIAVKKNTIRSMNKYEIKLKLANRCSFIRKQEWPENESVSNGEMS